MGMFDDITCHHPLPGIERWPELQQRRWQTKDTPNQFLDHYEIRADGTLWHEDYDTEDHSDAAKWKAANPGKELPPELASTLSSFCGCMTRVRTRWEPVADFTGEICFYGFIKKTAGGARDPQYPDCGWIEWSAYFHAGKLQQLHLVTLREPKA